MSSDLWHSPRWREIVTFDAKKSRASAAAVSRTVPRSLCPTIAHTARQKVPLHHRPARTIVGWAILPMRVMATDHRLRPSCRPAHRLGVCCVCCAPLWVPNGRPIEDSNPASRLPTAHHGMPQAGYPTY